MWNWLLKQKNQQVITWLGGGMVIIAGGLWTVYTYTDKPDNGPATEQKTEGDCSPNMSGVTVGNNLNINCSTIDNLQPSSEEQITKLDKEISSRLKYALAQIKNKNSLLNTVKKSKSHAIYPYIFSGNPSSNLYEEFYQLNTTQLMAKLELLLEGEEKQKVTNAMSEAKKLYSERETPPKYSSEKFIKVINKIMINRWKNL